MKPAKQGGLRSARTVKGALHAASPGNLTMFRFLRTQKRIEDLEETMERIDSAFKKLQVEWDDTYDKFRHLHMRVSKRMRDAEQAPEGDTTGGKENEQPGSSSLSPRQIEAQQRILARRGMKGLDIPRTKGNWEPQ